MENDFSKPQKQSAAGIIIMAANTIQKIIRALAIPFIIFIVKAKTEELFYFGIVTATLLVLSIAYSYLSYLKFTFFLDIEKQEFIINKGVFNKTLLTVQLEKIQQVKINQSLLQKLIGVYSLQIDTPGSDGKEISIKAIDETAAYRLKEYLLNGKKENSADGEISSLTKEVIDIPLLKLSTRTLFKVGLTSHYGRSLALLIGFAYALFHNAKELIKTFDKDNGQVESVIKSGISLFSVGILFGIILFILFAINIIRTFVKYFEFEVSKHKQSLLISSGLLAKKNTLTSPKKVQITTYSQNFFQRKFNLLNMNLKQAHSGKAESEKKLRDANLEIPGCNPMERDEILKMILGKLPEKAKTFKPNFRFLNLPIFFKVVFPVAIYFIFWYNFDEVKPYYPLSIVYTIIAIVMIYISYTKHRLMVNQDLIIKKSGIWDITFEHIFPHKIQAITTFQYPWHKGIDVGHVNLHTAAGIIHFKYGNYSEIKQLVNYWLYQIESGSEEWM